MNQKIEALLRARHNKQAAAMFLGNAGWVFALEGCLLATDPDVYGEIPLLAPPPFTAKELAPYLDYVCISHSHGDHFNRPTCKDLEKFGPCLFILPESCRAVAMDYGLQRIHYCQPNQTIKVGTLSVETTAALHGHVGGTVYEGASDMDCGYLIHGEEITLFQPGDSLLLESHQSLPPIDVLLLSPTEHNMWIKDSLRFVALLSPKLILPQHHSTYVEQPENYFWTHGYVEEVYNALPKEMKKNYHVPKIGELLLLKFT